ncbi:translation initiation factor IF-2 [bacterium]|nr:translation initiation factor IF-2 [bacterium]
MRVHSLAKELEIQTNQLITFLQSKGFDIKGPLNTLGDAEIDAARNNLAELKSAEKDKKTKKSPTSGVKKRVFVRSKQTTDPRTRPRRQPGSTQQIRPPQIPQRKQGTSKAAEKAMAHQKALAEEEKAKRTALDKKALKAQMAEIQPDASPADKKKIRQKPKRGKVAATDKKIDDRRDKKGKKEQVRTDPGRGKGTERPKKKKFKFSKEDAIRVARDKRRTASRNKPASQTPVTGSDALGVRKTQPMPADLRKKRKKGKPDFRGRGQATRASRKKEPKKDVVLKGKALDVGINKLKGGFKTSVDADKKAAGKTKRRKKIVQDKKRFKPGAKSGRRTDRTEYGGRGVLVRKHKRRKHRDIIPALADAAGTVDTHRKIRITNHMTIKDLSAATGVKSPTIVKFLLDEINVMATINQVVDIDMASLILESLGYEYEIAIKKVEDILKHDDDSEEDLKTRPPVVTVLGHVDHGKTKLLDTIRKTNVAEGEAGGITQAIGAYQVYMRDRAITFIDTPGHEAFTAMRARGAKVTDVAILVVACDDGVQPQTKEAIDHAKSAGIEIVVALNKIDLDTADPERVKAQLSELELIPEEWGGNTVMVPISAKFGDGIEELLDLVLLQADILDLKANPDALAEGTIIEAKIDKGKGALATVLIQRGTLKVGDYIVVGCSHGRIRAMLNEYGKKVKEVGPSTPVELFGLSDVPQAGDILNKVENEKIAKEIYDKRCLDRRQEAIRAVNKISLDDLYAKIKEGEAKELNLIIKTDTQGSIEAIIHALGKIKNPEVNIKFIHSSVGNVKESDIMLALASQSIILAFNVVVSAEMKKLALMEGVDVRSYNIIYKAVEDIELAMKGMLEPVFEEKIIGTAEVQAIFKKRRNTIVAGLIVTSGKLIRGKDIRITRGDEKIWEGKLSSLKRFQDDAREVDNGLECGISLDNIPSLEEGDVIEQYESVEVPRN